MVRHPHPLEATLMVALVLALAACGKQDDPPAAPAQAAAAAPSAPVATTVAQVSLADCDKLPDPRPADNSATGRATAVILGQNARRACKNEVTARNHPEVDPDRIRTVKGSDGADHPMTEAEWKQGIKDGARAPIKDYKY